MMIIVVSVIIICNLQILDPDHFFLSFQNLQIVDPDNFLVNVANCQSASQHIKIYRLSACITLLQKLQIVDPDHFFG